MNICPAVRGLVIDCIINKTLEELLSRNPNKISGVFDFLSKMD